MNDFFNLCPTGYNFKGHKYILVTTRSCLEVQSNFFSQRVMGHGTSCQKHLLSILQKKIWCDEQNMSVISAKRQTPLVHLSIETQEVVQWKSKHLHTRPSYDLNWSMLRQSGPLTHCNIDHIEAVQHRTARSTMKDWSRPANQQPAITTGTTQTIVRGSLSSMLQYLGWDSLEERRGTMLYRIVHGLVTIPLHHSNLQWNTRDIHGHSTKFYVPTVQVDAYRFNFFPATVTLWNNLPPDVVLSSYVNCFRTCV